MRAGTIRATPRTQESVAVSADGERWILLNASPDVRAQIEAFAPLHPRPPRRTPIAAVVLTNADLDHCLGLLGMREGTRLSVLSTDTTRRAFVEDNVLCGALDRIEWVTLAPGSTREIAELSIEAFRVPGKPPRYREADAHPSDDDNVGLLVRDRRGRTLAHAPSVRAWTGALSAALGSADCALVDGTFWSDDELIRLGLSTRGARQMGHQPIGGEDGILRAARGIGTPRKIFIHINNTNPILVEDSAERAEVSAAGWEVAWDGMDIAL
ncbi:Coenzyme PQQ synthesis protein B [Sandaracinus amylolyticus]|uniref:Coenzyme PQQ synthesis protein B n=1 Tax=Sandaracinus amylolyticus TaxID=927083 RepID=A0A0F6YHM4_9BACT|nr:Coenzyme PQQ synthesis protein B [Sandaracinus amylolyticus]